MQLHIKNMVCPRCKMAVEAILKKLGLHPVSIALGVVRIEEKKLTSEQEAHLTHDLSSQGFLLLTDSNQILIDQVKSFIITHVHYPEAPGQLKFSTLLAQHLHTDYSLLSKLFSREEGMTIEQFQIAQKIEKVKELLLYNELSLSQIAMEMNYSSTAHLSAQFRKVTGQTPTQYKNEKHKDRKSLDSLGKIM